MRILIYAGIVAISMMYTTMTISEAISCLPRPGQTWLMAASTSKCFNTKTITYVAGPFNVLNDVYLLTLPLFVVWNLQLPLQKKIGVSAIFASGFL